MVYKNSMISVVKTRSGRAPLNSLEIRVFCYLLTLLSVERRELMVNIEECVKALNIPAKDGGTNEGVVAALFRLGEEVLEEDSGGLHSAIPLFESLRLLHGNRFMEVIVNQRLVEVLVTLDRQKLMSAANCSSPYAMRLYEYLTNAVADHKGVLNIQVSLEDLRALFEADSPSYVHFGIFRERVLDPSVECIHTMTDLDLCYEYTKKGRKITGVTFTVARKSGKVPVMKKSSSATEHVSKMLQRRGREKTAQVMARITKPVREVLPLPGCFMDFGPEETIF